ncbi:glutaminase kidney isoform, mitochondrial-like isoform X2 [Cimex lectularius]|uniref:glutaminase n=1 Tax=Cimex lectularius TaxID=79782 RepID=A0A8I6RMF0_CIMLE|nr:glutaminase kidney isoform, mitochondrial-like isoform X2 [Cimex lectularius]
MLLRDTNQSSRIYKVSLSPSACIDNPVDTWGVAVTSVDGQRCFIGDSEKPFLLHSLCKPLIYGMAIDELGVLEVEKYIGHEPIHTQKDILCLDSQDRPRSPLLDSGFLVLCFLLFRNKDYANTVEVHRKVFRYFNALAGNEYCQHRTQVYMAAKQSGFHPFAQANLLVAMDKLAMDPNFNEACDFYYEAHSLETNCESLSLIAATLANGGINPLTLKQVLSPNAVKYVLSSMYTAGLYTFSGKSSFLMGNPGKSASSGAIMFVIPGVLGIALYSPKLNKEGISVRGLSFMKEFIRTQKFHMYANLTSRVKKKFPGRKNTLDECNTYCEMFSALASHDIPKVVKLAATDMVHSKDNEKRTVLHVAAAMGYYELVKHIASKYTYLVNEKDRWGRTPLDYAKISGSHVVVDILQEWEKIMQPQK